MVSLYSTKIFAVKTFVNSPKIAKFAKTLTRERFPLYGTIYGEFFKHLIFTHLHNWTLFFGTFYYVRRNLVARERCSLWRYWLEAIMHVFIKYGKHGWWRAVALKSKVTWLIHWLSVYWWIVMLVCLYLKISSVSFTFPRNRKITCWVIVTDVPGVIDGKWALRSVKLNIIFTCTSSNTTQTHTSIHKLHSLWGMVGQRIAIQSVAIVQLSSSTHAHSSSICFVQTMCLIYGYLLMLLTFIH